MKKYNFYSKTRILTFFVLLFISQVFTFVNAQSVPNPYLEFPLDANNPENWIDQNNISHEGVVTGIFNPATDRFGNSQGAIAFSSHASIFQGDYLPVIDANKDVTVSFWVYLDQTHTYPSGSSPFSPGDLKRRFFSLTTDYKSGGMARVEDNALLGIERTINTNASIKPWYLWLYKPAMMDQQGWYQIVAVMATDFTKVYVYKPDGTKVCKYNFMENNYAKKIVIGKKTNYPNENVHATNVMDDFKLWETALSEQQIDILNAQETNIIGGTYRINLAFNTSQKEYIHTSSQSQSTGAVVELYQLTGQEQYDYAYQWDIKEVLGGGYTIYMHNTAKGLTFDLERTALDTQVYLGGQSQVWHFEAVAGGNQHEYEIYSRNNQGEKVYLKTNSSTNSSNVYVSPYVSAFNDFILEKVYNPKLDIEGTYELVLDGESWFKMHTSSQSTANSANIEVYDLQGQEQYAYAYRWDFIRQLDNSYRIEMHNTGKYVHTSSQATVDDANIELYDFLADGERGYEWILEPTGQTDQYYIRLAATTNRYMNTYFQPFHLGLTPNVLLDHKGITNHTYNWKFKKVENPWVKVEGTYKVQLSASSSPPKYMHTSSQSTANSANIELYQLQGQEQYAYAYQWDFVRHPYNSYHIKMYNTSKYVHTSNQATGNSANIELYDFLPDGERGYEWILEPTGQADEYYIRLAATTDRYMHTSSQSTGNSANIELYKKISGQLQGYKWKLNKLGTSSAKNQSSKEVLNIVDNENFSENTIFPNPAGELLNVSLSLTQSDEVNLAFYDLLGRKIFSKNQKVNNGHQIVTLENLKDYGFTENQIYILKVTTSTGEQLLNTKVLFK